MKNCTKFLALLLALIISVCMFCVPSYALESSELLGDVNGDGKINIADVTVVQRHIAKLKTLDENSVGRAKVCGYTRLSILDATSIQRYIAKLISVFPAEKAETDTVTKVKNNITIYFTNNLKWSAVNARFFNRQTGDSINAEMKLEKKNKDGEEVYSAEVDVSKYDRVVFSNGTDETTDTPVTKASTGYFIHTENKKYNDKLVAGVDIHGKYGGKIDSVDLQYPEGYEKEILIWTPEGYDPNDDSKKYSVLYMTDGQNIFGDKQTRTEHEWRCDETAQSLMENGGDGIIIVGITSGAYRNDELTPEIGEIAPISDIPPEVIEHLSMKGEVFSDFVVNDVIPYVEKNYNTNSIRGFAGSSSGGLETFYIGMEHLDKFNYVGVISPAFDLFDEDAWNKYLGEKDFSGKVPRMYIYCGNNGFTEQIQYKVASVMEDYVKKAGYPSDKITTVLDEDADHNEDFWAIYFPEMLSWGMQF